MSIKSNKKNIPLGYEVIHWDYNDYAGKHKVFVPMYQGKAIYGQNTTFSSLGVARKKIHSHAETQTLLKKIADERKKLRK